MSPPAPACAPLGRRLACTACACAAGMAVLLFTGSVLGQQPKGGVPASLHSIAQTLTTVSGVPTLLTVNGAGNCKFRLSYQKQDKPPTLSAPWVFSSTPQEPFPLHLKILDATPPGTYTWTANGVDGCMGSQSLTFTVR